MQVWNVLHAASWKYGTQKSRQKSLSGHHRATLSGYISWQLRHTYRQFGKNLLSSNISSRCLHNMVNLGPLAAEIDPVVWASQVISMGSRLGIVTARHPSSGRQPNCAALNKERHLCSAGRPSRWALAHILVLSFFPRLISAVGDWIPAVLPHMVWP